MLDIQKEKKLIITDTNKLFHLLNENFPWIIAEIALSMKENLGQDNPFIKECFQGVLEDLSKEALEKYIPECKAQEASVVDVATSVLGSNRTQFVSDTFSKTSLGLDEEESEECLPWDEEEQNTVQYGAGARGQNLKLANINNVKMKLREMVFYKVKMRKYEADFKDEIITLNIIFEVLDFIY